MLCSERTGKQTPHSKYYVYSNLWNVRVFLYYVYIPMYTLINKKRPCVSIIHFYILVWLNIQGNFISSLSVRVSNSGQPFNSSSKYCIKTNNFNIYTYPKSRFTPHCTHHTLLYTRTVQHTKTFLCQPVSISSKYCTKRNWVDSKIYSIKSDNSPPWLNQNQFVSNRSYKFLCTSTRWTCHFTAKGIYYFYSLLMILNIPLKIFF